MLKNLNLTQKIAISISAVLIVTAALGFWINRSRVNQQAENAFRDKLRQITGMASGTRVWFSQNIDTLVPNHEFKHLEQVPVVVAWKVAKQYTQSAGMEFHTPSLQPRNSHNQADAFERRALQSFQQDPDLKEYSERVTEGGREWMRYAQPVRLTQDCLVCHGDPVGSKDPFGNTREGMKVGDLRGAFAVKAPVDELVANASANSRVIFLTSFLTLLAAIAAAILVLRSGVIKPVSRIREVLVAFADGDLTRRLEISNQDEVGEMARALNTSLDKITGTMSTINKESITLANASEEFSVVSRQISANSEETSAQANAVSAASEEVDRNLQTVATATEEISASVREISKNAEDAAKVAAECLSAAVETNSIVSKLSDSSAEIGKVIKDITSIAQKTDLLALNATVEAARAGEVGAGFAVVANEVKDLAKQTAAATENISRKIQAIQTDATGAVAALSSISSTIGKVNDISASIATAVAQQASTTDEMSRNLSEAAKGSGEVVQNIHGVAEAARSTSQGASDSQKAAQQLALMSTQLRELVQQFKVDAAEHLAVQKS